MRIISKRNGFKLDNPKRKKQQRLIGRIHNAGEYQLAPTPLFEEPIVVVPAGPQAH